MSGTWPTSPGPASIQLIPKDPVLDDTAQSGKSQSRIIAGKLWGIQIAYDEQRSENMAPVFAFANSQRGDSFQIVVPGHDAPLGVATGAPVVDGAHVAGDSTVAIRGFTPSTAAILKAGTVLKFGNHSKVYMLNSDVDSDINGETTLNLDIPIIEALAGGESLIITNVPFTVKVDGEIQAWRTKSPRLSRYTADLIEKI